MNCKQLIFIAAALGLAACTSTPIAKHKEQAVTHQGKEKTSVSLENMDVQFLYLAYQQALEARQYPLAASFLQALTQKDPDALEPKLELVELYLGSGKREQAKAALQVMASVPENAVNNMQGEDLVRYELLYARTWVANGDVNKASRLLQGLLEAQPKHVEVRLLLLRMYVLQGNINAAHMVLTEGLNIHSDPRLQQAQVQLFLQEKNIKAADHILASMQKEYPDHEDVVLQRSQLAEQQGDTKKAERLLKTYIDKHGADAAESFSMLAALYVRHERFKDAVLMYKHLLQLTENVGSVYMSLGKVYYQLAEFEKAADAFAHAVAQLSRQAPQKNISETQASAYFYWGASLEASRQLEKAVSEYERVLPEHTFYLDAQVRLASMEIASEKYKAAETRVKELLDTHKNNLELYELLSGLRLQEKNFEKLLSDTEPALKLGFSKVVLFNRAVAFESLKRFSDLDNVLNSLLKNDPNHAEALNFYGYSLADRGVRLDDALAMITKALRIKPEDGYYLDSLAWVYFKQGQYAKAVEIQRRAVVLVATDPVMQEHLGDMYWKANDPENARKHWKKAMDLNHSSPNILKFKIEHGLT